MTNTLYIVAGMHRSGTSLVAKMMEVFGVTLPGELVGPAEDNAKGFFEDRAFVELNDQVLTTLGLQWDSLHGFFLEPADFNSPRLNHLKKKAKDLLADRAALDNDWAVKDPRMCRLAGFWLPLIDALNIPCRFVLVYREPAGVVGSLEQRNRFEHLKSLYLWNLYTLDILSATGNRDRVLVNYDSLVQSPGVVLDELAGFMPPELPEVRQAFIESFLERGMKHHGSVSLTARLETAEDLYRCLIDKELDDERIARIRTELTGDDRIQALFEYAAEREQRFQEELANQEAEITRFSDYQIELERKLSDQRDWSAKLESDVASLQGNADGLTAALAEASEVIEQRDASIVQLQGELGALNSALEKEREAWAAESVRLWEIIEMYRLQAEAMEISLSWRVTAPLRWIRRQLGETPRRLRRVVKSAVFSLPADSMVRQTIVTLFERGQLLVNGGLDNQSIRASHRAIIGDRQRLTVSRMEPVSEVLPALDISVVTYNSSQWITGFRASLLAQDYPLSRINLIFVDNDSSDDTRQQLTDQDWSAFAGFRLIRNRNTGYGSGHNLGIAAGDGDLLLVTNIDLEFRAESLTRAVAFALEDQPEVASWELRQAPYEHPKFYDPVSLQTGWSTHACVLMRRSALRVVGGYEERIFMYGEDVELSYRFRSRGYKLRYLPFAVVDHYTYEEPGEIKRLQFQGSTLANAYIRMRYGSPVDIARILPMYAGLAAAQVDVPGKGTIVRDNIVSILRNTGYFLRSRSTEPGFSFRDWDYDIVREGAFLKASPLPDSPPLVSVITRTYRGREALLLECMQSVAHQTYPNIEHIIVEDGGDSLESAVRRFADACPSVEYRYFPLDKLGRCEAGNAGLAAAKGEFLVFLDDDDLFFADHLEVCVGELCADDAIAATYALAWEVETEFADGVYEEKSHGTPDIHRQPFDRQTLQDHNYIPIQAIVFRRSLYDRHGGFDPELENLEDWNLWVRYASDAEFRLIAKTTSMYRTPWDITEKSRRQAILDGYLPIARARNTEALT